jgi:hypothetical protein
MKNNLATVVLFLTMPCSLFAQSKVDKRLANSAMALQAILEGDNGLPKSVLNQAVCVCCQTIDQLARQDFAVSHLNTRESREFPRTESRLGRGRCCAPTFQVI